jgi:hypothetical protein
MVGKLKGSRPEGWCDAGEKGRREEFQRCSGGGRKTEVMEFEGHMPPPLENR